MSDRQQRRDRKKQKAAAKAQSRSEKQANDKVHAFLDHPVLSAALGLVLVVLGNGMNSQTSNGVLVAAWLLFVWSAYTAGATRSLLRAFLCAGVVGTGLYFWLWTPLPQETTVEIARDIELKREAPLFQSKSTLTMRHAHDMCGDGDCYYRIDLDGAGLMVVDDVSAGRIHFRIFKGPFVEGPNTPEFMMSIRPDNPIRYRSPDDWPFISATDKVVTDFGPKLGEVQFDLYGRRSQIIKASGRTFEVTLSSFQSRTSEPKATTFSGDKLFAFSFSVNERP